MDYWWLLLTEGIPRSESGPYIHDRTGENLIFCPIDPFVDRWKSVKPFFQIQPGSPLFQTKLKKKLLLIFQGFVRKFCWLSVGENIFFPFPHFSHNYWDPELRCVRTHFVGLGFLSSRATHRTDSIPEPRTQEVIELHTSCLQGLSVVYERCGILFPELSPSNKDGAVSDLYVFFILVMATITPVSYFSLPTNKTIFY